MALLTAFEKPLMKRCKACTHASVCRPGRKGPSLTTLEKWDARGGCKTPSGAWVEPDGRDQHGCPSWLLILGFI